MLLGAPIISRVERLPGPDQRLSSQLSMELKDYYSILRIPVTATAADIKKAYREMAQKFHPDKNQGNPESTVFFAEIKEAYEVLINPSRKEYYLQQRWYAQSSGRKKYDQPITPVSVLKRMLELDKYVSRLDTHRMNKKGLNDYLLEILSEETIQKLNGFREPAISDEIIRTVLNTSQNLPLLFAEPLTNRLRKLNATDSSISVLDSFIRRKKRSAKVELLKPWLILLCVVAISILIWLVSR